LVPDWIVVLTWTIFALTYAGLALGKIPGLRTDRAGIALVGATLMLVTGVVSLDEAVSTRSIDYKTLLLLFGMMIVVGGLRLSGFFERLANAALVHITTPGGMLAATIGLSGLLSAFLINDVVCVALTPLVVHLARRLKFDPLPHLIGLATAANIGSTGTITGNPQNIFIGSHSGIAYLTFAARLMPVALLGLLVDYFVIRLVYRQRLVAKREPDSANVKSRGIEDDRPIALRGRAHAALERKAVIVTVLPVLLFFTGLPLELVALGAAGVMLLGRVNPKKIYGQVDWSLLVMFAGLFVVVHAFQMHVVSGWNIETWSWLLSRPVDLLSLVSAGLSNLVSNVPAVLLLEPVVGAMPDGSHETAWLALAMSSTLAGNLTVLGSVANLIVVESARREGATISFWEYSKVGIPITLLTLGLGIAWLQFVHY
jgi:Na+/H+ antiporter NhaD/arsenite permease-like protein